MDEPPKEPDEMPDEWRQRESTINRRLVALGSAFATVAILSGSVVWLAEVETVFRYILLAIVGASTIFSVRFFGALMQRF